MPLYRPHPLESREGYSHAVHVLQKEDSPFTRDIPNQDHWRLDLTHVEQEESQQHIASASTPQLLFMPLATQLVVFRAILLLLANAMENSVARL